jgi:hypothetical protein
MNLSIKRGETIALFAILFVLLGVLVPMAYIQVAPESQFIEVHNFTADDTHVQAEEHNVYFNRTVKRPAEATVLIEMKLIREDGSIVEEDSFDVDAYYQKGQEKIIIPRKIRERTSLEPGTYRYVDAVTLTYYNGLVERTFVHKSNNFTVYENESDVPD